MSLKYFETSDPLEFYKFILNNIQFFISKNELYFYYAYAESYTHLISGGYFVYLRYKKITINTIFLKNELLKISKTKTFTFFKHIVFYKKKVVITPLSNYKGEIYVSSNEFQKNWKHYF